MAAGAGTSRPVADASRAGAASRTRVVAAAVATGLVCLPFVVVIVTRAGRPLFPTQDIAVIALRARDVFTLHPPMVGAWSRVSFAHPGPIFYWYLGIPSVLTGGAPWSLVVGQALAHIGFIAIAARLAWRRGGLTLTLLVLLAIVLMYVAIDPWGLIAPWNVFFAYPLFAVFLLLAWSVGVGETNVLPWLAVAASALVQSHLGYAVVVVLPLVWVAARLVLLVRARVPLPALARGLTLAAVWTFVLWIPPLVDQVLSTRNLDAIVSYFASVRDVRIGPWESARLLAAEFRFVPPWLKGPRLIQPFTTWAGSASVGWLLILAALVAVAVAAVRRRGLRSGRRALVGLALVTLFASWLGMALVTGDRYAYLFEWRTTAVLVFLVACAWALVPRLLVHRRAVAAARALSAMALVGASVVLVYRVLEFPQALFPWQATSERLVDDVLPRAKGRGPILVRAVGREGVGVAAAIVNESDRRGDPVFVDPSRAFKYGDNRTIEWRDARRIWIVTEDGWSTSRLAAVSGGRLLASSRALPPKVEGELAALQRAMFDQLRAAGLDDRIASLDSPLFPLVVAGDREVDHSMAERIGTLNRRAARAQCRCSIAEFPADRVTRERLARFESPPRRTRE